MKKIFKVVLVLSVITLVLTGCDLNKEEEKGASSGNEEKYSDKILTDQEAVAIGKDLYDKALKLKRFPFSATEEITKKLSDAWVPNSYGSYDCPANNEKECYSILVGYDEYADKFLTKDVKEQFISEDKNLDRTEDGEVKRVNMVAYSGDISAMSVGFEVKDKKKDEITFDAIQYYCEDIENYSKTGVCKKESIKVRETSKYVISKDNDIWKVSEATIPFK